MKGIRAERGLAVVGAAAILVLGFDSLTYAATGGSLLLGRANTAGSVTTVTNTGKGAALALNTKSTASAPFTTNAKGRVKNLYADRAANADKVGGLTTAQILAQASNATTLGGSTKDQILAAAANATTLDGATKDQILATASNAITLGGATKDQIIASAGATTVTYRDEQLRKTPSTRYPDITLAAGTYLATFDAGVYTGGYSLTCYLQDNATGDVLAYATSVDTFVNPVGPSFSAASFSRLLRFTSTSSIAWTCETTNPGGGWEPASYALAPTLSFTKVVEQSVADEP